MWSWLSSALSSRYVAPPPPPFTSAPKGVSIARFYCARACVLNQVALSKCASSWQFCRLQSISCRLLHIGLHSEPPTRQGDLVFAAYYSFYAAYCYKTVWKGCQVMLHVLLCSCKCSCNNCCTKLIVMPNLILSVCWEVLQLNIKANSQI